MLAQQKREEVRQKDFLCTGFFALCQFDLSYSNVCVFTQEGTRGWPMLSSITI
jgi:hypothetical protein